MTYVFVGWWAAFPDGSAGLFFEEPDNALYTERVYRRLDIDNEDKEQCFE